MHLYSTLMRNKPSLAKLLNQPLFLSPQFFDGPSLLFQFQPLFFGCLCWFRGAARFRSDACPLYEFIKAPNGILSVFLLGAKLMRFNDENPCVGEAFAAKFDQARFHIEGERIRPHHVEA